MAIMNRTRTPYLTRFLAGDHPKRNLFFFLILDLSHETISCKIPRGHITEQYTRPKSRVASNRNATTSTFNANISVKGDGTKTLATLYGELFSAFYNLVNNYYVLCLWVVYAYVAALILIGGVNLVSGFIALFSASASFHYFAMTLYCFMGIYLIFLALTAMAILVSYDQITLGFVDKIKLLFIHPLFYMKYISIVAKALVNKEPQTWEVIERIKVQK